MAEESRRSPPPSYDQIYGPQGPSAPTPPHSLLQPFASAPSSFGLPPLPIPASQSTSLPNQEPQILQITPNNVIIDYDSQMWFAAVDENGDGRITLYELQEALINFDGKPFDWKTCKSLVRMFDVNSDGTIDVREFCALKQYIEQWKTQFDRIDNDGSGNIDHDEFHLALRNLGYQLSPAFARLAVEVFGNTRNRDSLNFDAFIRSCALVHSLSSQFNLRQHGSTGDGRPPDGVAAFDFEQFSRIVFEFGLADC